MPGRTHADHGRDHVDAAEDRAETSDGQAQDPQVTAGTRRMNRVGQRAIGGPAEVCGTARGDEAGHRDHRAEQEQPEAQRVQPRERDVGSADLQRKHQVGEPEHDRGGVEQQHHRAVHGEQLVELLVGQELQAGQRELGAHEQRQQPADEEEDEAGDAVHDADQLVIGGGHQLVDQVPLGTEPRRERTTGLEFSDWGCFGYQEVLQTSIRACPHCSVRILSPDGPSVGMGPTNRRISVRIQSWARVSLDSQRKTLTPSRWPRQPELAMGGRLEVTHLRRVHASCHRCSLRAAPTTRCMNRTLVPAVAVREDANP